MKAVLLSIRPKWCELIASGHKTVEVRKTRPLIETPFKCFIYCTKPKQILRFVWRKEDYRGYFDEQTFNKIPDDEKVFCKVPDGSSPFCSPPYSGKVIGEFVCDEIFKITESCPTTRICGCISDIEFDEYAGSKIVYAYNISDLVIYEKPKELSRFCAKPPQSWCYVEVIE